MTTTIEIDRKRLICPVCKAAVTDGRSTCLECGEDLSPLVFVDNLAPLHLNEGLRLASEGRTDQAIEQLLAALTFDPAHTEALIVLGKLQAQQGRYAQAITYWQRALALDQNNVKAQAGIRKAQTLQRRARRIGLLRRTLIAVMILVALLVGGSFASFLGRSDDAQLAQSSEQVTPTAPAIQAQPPTAIAQEQSLAEAVRQAFQADDDLGPLELLIRQDGPVVYLNGTVPRPELKVQAEALAKEVPGVGPVDSSGIAVVPPPLAEAVWRALQASSNIGPLGLEVEQRGHSVHISGSVPTAELKDQAVKIAHSVEGVDRVDSSSLIVALPPLAETVQQKLTGDSRLAGLDIDVEQMGNDIRLSGTVTRADLKGLAEDLTGEVEGVDLVDSRNLAVVPPSLAEAVQQALRADARTADLMIEVKQVGLSIRLEGIVPTLEAKMTVESVTRDVTGVELVDTGGVLVEPSSVDYVVQTGDSLAAIARKFYGDEAKWPLIYEANRELIARPGQLQPGIRLVIPQNIS